MFLKSAIAVALFAPLLSSDPVPPGDHLTVHEWGTFTSVAGEDGTAERWVSLSPPADLPCFVNHLTAQCIKCGQVRVRMETPVIYFYAPEPVTASVHVDLPTGLITEWYPQGKNTSALQDGMTYQTNGNIEWRDVHVLPGSAESFPNMGDRSHYYAARETDSAPLQVGTQAEKVLFYRGIADFVVDLWPRFLSDGKIEIRNGDHQKPIGTAILFENRGGRTGYRVMRDLRDKALLDPPELSSNANQVQGELASALVGAGLYPKEAAAMLATWDDSWFEEGMRVIYLVPRKTADQVLPLNIKPAPAAIERVFVGRVEILSPAMRETITAALKSGDIGTLRKYGRFARPFCDRITQGNLAGFSGAAVNFVYSGQPVRQPGPCKVEPSSIPTEPQQP